MPNLTRYCVSSFHWTTHEFNSFRNISEIRKFDIFHYPRVATQQIFKWRLLPGVKIPEYPTSPTLKPCARKWGTADFTFHRHGQPNEQAEMVPFFRHKNKHLKDREQARVQENKREVRSRQEVNVFFVRCSISPLNPATESSLCHFPRTSISVELALNFP